MADWARHSRYSRRYAIQRGVVRWANWVLILSFSMDWLVGNVYFLININVFFTFFDKCFGCLDFFCKLAI